ncbi:hypothetical protein Tco_0119047, partial [Tanacetum coccineum]
GAGDKPEVPDVPKYNSDSEEESWTFSGGDDDEDVNKESDAHDDSDENESNDEEYQEDDDMEDGEEYDDEEMLYGDLNLNRERIDARMTEAHATKDTEDANVNPTAVTHVAQQQSSSALDLVSKFINPSMDEGIDSVLNQNIQSDTLVDIPVTTATDTPSSDTITLQPSTLHIHSLQTPVMKTLTSFPTTTLPEIPNFASLFGFDQRVTTLESELSMLKQSNPFAKAISFIPGIVEKYIVKNTSNL